MIISVYIDESGTHQSGVLVMGGLVGRLGQWVNFDKKWNRLRRVHGVSYFHAKSMKHRQGSFKGWSPDRIDGVMRKLSKTIHRNIQFGFTIAVGDDDFKTHYRNGSGKIKGRLDSQYGFCFRCCLSLIPEIAVTAWGDDRLEINFILENGHRNAGDALRIFDEWKKSKDTPTSRFLGTIAFGENEDYPGLQGADFPAHAGFGIERSGEADIHVTNLGGFTAGEVVARKSELASAPVFRTRITAETLHHARAQLLAKN